MPVGIELGGMSRRRRRGAITAFSPSQLFASNEQGLWLDPSDTSTLFQDSAGTTPVTAVEQAVGLMLDKSKGLLSSTNTGFTPASGAGHSFNTPDSVANSITGDIDIRWYGYTILSAAGGGTFCGKWGSAGQQAYAFDFAGTAGALRFYYTSDGSTSTGRVATSSVTPISAGLTNNVPCGLRATYKTSTGEVLFYYDKLDGLGWVQLGATQTITSGAIFDTTGLLYVNDRMAASVSAQLNTSRLQIYNGINGTLAVDFDPTRYTGGTTFIAATGEVWTLTGAGTRITPSGNHVSASADARRPILRARYNGIRYTEKFANSESLTAVTCVNDVADTLAPNGTQTASRATETTANSVHNIFMGSTFVPSTAGLRQTISVYAKAGTCPFIQLTTAGSASNPYANFDLINGTVTATGGTTVIATSITDAGDGWWRCVMIAEPVIGGSHSINMLLTGTGARSESYTGTSRTVFLWGRDLRVTNDGVGLPEYQRVGAVDTDYDTVGFPPYLAFDGVDDCLFTASTVNFTATDEMTVVSGARKLSDAAQGALLESSPASTNVGRFNIFAPASTGASGNFQFSSRGTIAGSSATSATTLAPVSAILTGRADISSPLTELRINGAVSATNTTTSQGTGNYGNYAFFVGARNNSTTRFNGRIYGIIVRGATTATPTLEQTETWMNGKTEAY